MSEWISAWWKNPDTFYPEIVLTCLGALGVVLLLRWITPRAATPTPQPLTRIVRLALLLAVLGAACTAYGAVLRGHHLHGWMLFAHLIAGGAMVGLLPFYACTGYGRGCGGTMTLLAAIATLMTVLLAMLPVFATPWQYRLLTLHRYAALWFFCSFVLARWRVISRCN